MNHGVFCCCWNDTSYNPCPGGYDGSNLQNCLASGGIDVSIRTNANVLCEQLLGWLKIPSTFDFHQHDVLRAGASRFEFRCVDARVTIYDLHSIRFSGCAWVGLSSVEPMVVGYSLRQLPPSHTRIQRCFVAGDCMHECSARSHALLYEFIDTLSNVFRL